MIKTVNTDFLKVGLYGDSLAMCRPNQVSRKERYFYHVKSFLKGSSNLELEVLEKAKASVPISELSFLVLHDSVYYPEKGDVFILQSGIVDCSPRPISMVARDRISKLPNCIKNIIVKFLHKNRARMLKNNGPHYVTPLSDFMRYYREILEISTKQYSIVILINICPTLSKIEQHSPGLSKSIERYNAVINDLYLEFKKMNNIYCIDIFSILMQQKNIEDYIFPDGHHISPRTHSLIAEEIIKVLNSNFLF